MVFIRTLGEVDMPGSGPRKLPAPGIYVAIVFAWLGLEILAESDMEDAANTAGWGIVLASLVLGPFGNRLVKFINVIGNDFSGLASSNVAAGQGNVTSGPLNPPGSTGGTAYA